MVSIKLSIKEALEKPIRSKPWLINNHIDNEEINAVIEVLKSGKLSGFEGSYTPSDGFSFYGGENVLKLESAFAKRYQTTFATSFNSATSGIFSAFGALEVGFGDEVIVPCATMTACAPLAMYFGAIPIFSDVDSRTGCISYEHIKELTNNRTKAILVVHQFGIPAEIEKIVKFARDRGIKVIEDCAQAYDTKRQGKVVGGLGDIAIFSLNINKTIQSGEGGICLTNSKDINNRLCLIRNHGENVLDHIYDKNQEVVNIIGLNLRMTEIEAAIAQVQLMKLGKLNTTRSTLAKYLKNKLKDIDSIEVLDKISNTDVNTYYQFTIRFKFIADNEKLNDIVKLAKANGIILERGQKPLVLQRIYQKKSAFKFNYPFSARENTDIKTNYDIKHFPVSNKLYNSTLICELVRPPHTNEDLDDIYCFFNKYQDLFKV